MENTVKKFWCLDTKNKHVERSIKKFLLSQGENEENYYIYDESGKSFFVIGINEVIVERLLSDGDMNPFTNFFCSTDGSKTYFPVSNQDAWSLVTGKNISSSKVVGMLYKSALEASNNSYATKILNMINSKIAILKVGGKKKSVTIQLLEEYKGKEKLDFSDLKERDRTLYDRLKILYENLGLKKAKKNFFFEIKLSNAT